MKPYSIARKGKTGNNYLIQLDLRKRRITNLSSKNFNIFCDPPGVMRSFAQPVREKLSYTLAWDDEGHLDTEAVYDWAKRGRPIAK